MKTARLTRLREFEIHEAPQPSLKKPDDVLLRVCSVGVCGSDVHYYSAGRIGTQVVEYPWIIGHECMGVVAAVGEAATDITIGQRVMVDPLITCGRCDQCRIGRKNTCREQVFLGCPGQIEGALAEYLVMPRECCYPIPDNVTDAQAVVIEPLAISLHASRLAGMPPGATAGVLGTGPIGLCVMLAAKAAGECSIYATDLLDERLAVARDCGADWTGNPTSQDIVDRIYRDQPDGLDYVFECAGESETLEQAVLLLKPGGTLMLVGIPEGNRISLDMNHVRRKELRMLNVRRQNECTSPAIDLISSGAIDLTPLITHHFPLERVAEAFDMVAEYRDGVVKAIIDMPGE